LKQLPHFSVSGSMMNLGPDKKRILFTLILTISYAFLYSTNYSSKQDGNWNSSSTWSPAGIPGLGDNVTIQDVVTLTGSQSCNTLTIATEYCPSPWYDIFCFVTPHIYPELILGANTLTVVGSFTNNDILTANTGTVTFTGTGTIGGSNVISFYNLIINSSGTVTLAKDIAVTNLLTMTTGILNTITYSMNGAGGISATGGELQMAKLNTTLPELAGTYTITGGIVNFTGGGSQTIRNTTYYDLSISGSGTKTSGGVIDINRNLIISTATTLSANNNNITIAGNWTNNGGTFTPGTNTVTFDGTSSQAINGTSASQTFYNLTVNMTAGQNLTTGGSTTALTTQNLIQTTGNFTAPATLTINGNNTLTSGTFTAGTNIYAKGNWTNDGGTFAPGTNTVTFNGTGAQAINGTSASQAFYNLTINMTAGQNLTTGGSTTALTTQNLTQTTGNFTAPATLTINGNNTLTSGTFTAGTNIYAKGNWTNNGGTFTPGTNTVTFNGIGAQAINGTSASQTFYNLIVNLTAGQNLTTGGSTIALTTQNLTQTTGNFTAPATLTINGNYTLTSGTFTAGTNIYAKGNWTNNGGTFTPGTNTITLNGISAQIIGGLNPNNFYNLTISNTFVTSPQITLSSNIGIQNILNMTSGTTNLAGYTFTLGTSSASPGTLTYTAGWMYGGNLTRYFNLLSLALGDSEGHFPIGSVLDYRPFWVSHTSLLLSGGSITVSHTGIYPAFRQNVNFSDLTWNLGTTVKFLSESYWSMTVNGLTAGLSVFSIRAQATGLGMVNNVNDLNLSMVGGVIGLFSSSGGTTTNPQVNRVGLSLTDLLTGGTRTFYVGSKSNSSALPVSLLKFEALLKNKQTVDVSWATASETNNDYFTVEKSSDAINYEKVLDIKGAGNSNTMLNYMATDYYPLTGQSYYRLKQTDFDGKYSYSNIIGINTTTNSILTIFPNPAATGDNIQLNIPDDLKDKEISINVHDLQGKKIYSKFISIDNRIENKTIISEKLSAGSYMVNVISGSNIYKQLLIVR
jgi:hypothetical protein